MQSNRFICCVDTILEHKLRIFSFVTKKYKLTKYYTLRFYHVYHALFGENREQRRGTYISESQIS